MVIKDYTKATKTEITNEIVEEHRAKKLVEKENIKKTDFYKARELAFKQLENKYQLDKQTLAKSWQDKEDAGYVI